MVHLKLEHQLQVGVYVEGAPRYRLWNRLLETSEKNATWAHAVNYIPILINEHEHATLYYCLPMWKYLSKNVLDNGL